jgi:RNA polymerase sigma factor (sigma-70 family)
MRSQSAQADVALEMRHTLGATTVLRDPNRVGQRLKRIADQALMVPRTSESKLRALAEQLLVLESAALRLYVACNECPVEYAAALQKLLGESEYQKVRGDSAKLAVDCGFAGERLREFLGHRELNLLGALRPFVGARRGQQLGNIWRHCAPRGAATPYSAALALLESEWLSIADEMQAKSQYIALEALAYFPFDLEYAEDLYQEASYGLRRAIVKYNPAVGGHFRPYASMYAYRFALRAAIDLPHTIAIPYNLHSDLVALMRSGIDASAGNEREEDGNGGSDSRRKSGAALAMALAVQPVTGGAHFELLGPRELAQVQCAVAGGERSQVDVPRLERHLADAFTRVKARDRRIFLDYVANDEATLEDIGARHDLTRERARQIINNVREKILRRLPDPSEYVDDPRTQWNVRVTERWVPVLDATLAQYEGRALAPSEVKKRRYIGRRMAAQARDWQLVDRGASAPHVFVNEQILAFLKGGK